MPHRCAHASFVYGFQLVEFDVLMVQQVLQVLNFLLAGRIIDQVIHTFDSNLVLSFVKGINNFLLRRSHSNQVTQVLELHFK